MPMQHIEVVPIESSAVDIAMNAASQQRPRLSELAMRHVAEFPAPRIDPLCYPGLRPEYGFSLHGESVLPVRAIETDEGVQFGITTQEGVYNLDHFLHEQGAAPMADRVPIVGFGSNASPGQLREKFSAAQDRHHEIEHEVDRQIIPTLRGNMKDVAAAYSSKLGIHGYVFAELIEAQGAEVDVFINFLTLGQLARMIRSEGEYELCDIGQVQIDGLSRSITAYGFAGKNPVLLDKLGKPILLESVHPRGVNMPSMTEVEVLDMLATEFGPDIDAQYPHAPFFANSASNLMAYMSYRRDYLRRENTLAMRYTHQPAQGESPDPLVKTFVHDLLVQAGRVSKDKLLDHIPADKRNVSPQAFGSLYTAKEGVV